MRVYVCVCAKNGNKHTTVSIELHSKTDLSTGLVRIRFGTLYMISHLNVHIESDRATEYEGKWERKSERERQRKGTEKMSARRGWNKEGERERENKRGRIGKTMSGITAAAANRSNTGNDYTSIASRCEYE